MWRDLRVAAVGMMAAGMIMSNVSCSERPTSVPEPSGVAAVDVGQAARSHLVRDQSSVTMVVGESLQLDERAIYGSWSSSDRSVATVTPSGVVTAHKLGRVTMGWALVEDRSMAMEVFILVAVSPIRNIRTFLEICPADDPVYQIIQQDFEILSEGQPTAEPMACDGPYSTLPIAQLTDELISRQILRTAYYMSLQTKGTLPWTSLSFYAWLKSNVDGINFKPVPPGNPPPLQYCCDVIGGKSYFSVNRQDDAAREYKRTWIGISNSLTFYAHEIRHADLGSPLHVSGCMGFPDFPGCDQTYDLNNLGAFGVQYWLESQWINGDLNVGIACSPPAIAQDYAEWHESALLGYTKRFVTSAPPVVTATQPNGGICLE